MKKLFFLTVGIVMFCSCEETELLPQDKKLSLYENYIKDAQQLYYHEIFNNEDHPEYNNPIIDTNEVNKVLKIIEAVYNSDSQQRDTVFEIYSIHNRYNYSFNSITLQVQPDESEIENMVNMIIPTGNSKLDNILTTYQFDSVQTGYKYPDISTFVIIYSSREYNMLPIQKELKEISSILLTEITHLSFDGNNITLERNEDSAIITFSIGYGDCMAGCMQHRYWEFKVVGEQAEFIQAYGN